MNLVFLDLGGLYLGVGVGGDRVLNLNLGLSLTYIQYIQDLEEMKMKPKKLKRYDTTSKSWSRFWFKSWSKALSYSESWSIPKPWIWSKSLSWANYRFYPKCWKGK